MVHVHGACLSKPSIKASYEHSRREPTFSIKGHTAMTTTQLCYCSWKAAPDNTYTQAGLGSNKTLFTETGGGPPMAIGC